MTTHSRLSALLAVLALALTLAACGEVQPTAKRGDLLQEYFRSGDVEGDIVTGSGEDRIANLASMGAPQDFVASLFSAHPCDQPIAVFGFTTECQAPAEARADGGETLQRFVLVKHEDASLELLRLTLARGAGGSPVLYDAEGGRYPGGLQDFRENNDLLDNADQVLAPEPITATDGRFRLVVVTGQAGGSPWVWWLVGGLGAVVVVGLATLLLRARRAANPPPRRRVLESGKRAAGSRGASPRPVNDLGEHEKRRGRQHPHAEEREVEPEPLLVRDPGQRDGSHEVARRREDDVPRSVAELVGEDRGLPRDIDDVG